MLLGGRLHERLRQINPRKVAPQVAWFQKSRHCKSKKCQIRNEIHLYKFLLENKCHDVLCKNYYILLISEY